MEMDYSYSIVGTVSRECDELKNLDYEMKYKGLKMFQNLFYHGISLKYEVNPKCSRKYFLFKSFLYNPIKMFNVYTNHIYYMLIFQRIWNFLKVGQKLRFTN